MPFTPAASDALAGPDWVRTLRAAAAGRFAAMELPTEAEEIWRYSRIDDLNLDSYEPPSTSPADSSAPATTATLTAGGESGLLDAVLASTGDRAALLVLRDGHVVRREIDPALEKRGLFVGNAFDLAEAAGAPLIDDEVSGSDVFTELNTAFLTAVAVVEVPAGLAIENPIVIVQWIEADHSATFPRTVVRAGADSQVTVVEYQGSNDVSAFVGPVVDMALADAARVDYVNVQALGSRVTQIGLQASRVSRDATLRSTVVALGGDYARVRSDSRVEGKGATAELSAVYFADGNRMHDFRTLQDHVAPTTNSNLLFKGAVSGTGRSVYSGLIRVGTEANGTKAFQTNRNLVLSKGASAESVPNLEILTDDVSCSHASSVGPIDEEQRFYLESRGIPPEVAERLIILGFLGEVLDRLPTPRLAADLRATMAERLAHIDHGDDDGAASVNGRAAPVGAS